MLPFLALLSMLVSVRVLWVLLLTSLLPLLSLGCLMLPKVGLFQPC